MRQELRPYQRKLVDDVREALRGRRAIIARAPTGAGKTTVMTGIVELALAKGRPAWVMVHRKELAAQASARFEGQGMKTGVTMAGPCTNPLAPVQIISVPTLVSRLQQQKRGASFHRFNLPPPPDGGIVLFDEAHHMAAEGWLLVAEYVREARVVGLSATPWGPGGKALPYFEAFVDGPSPKQLLADGFLCDAHIYAGPAPNLDGLKESKATGDWKQGDVEERMAPLVGDIVKTWQRLAPGRRTLCFATSKHHSQVLVEMFRRAGIAAEHVDDATPAPERKAIFERLSFGTTKVVSNVGIVTEGFDCPAVEAVILARPTKSESLFLQMVGRALRPFDDKTAAIILDHGYNAARFGSPFMEREVTINGRPPRAYEPTQKELEEGGMFFRVCPDCLHCNDVDATECSCCHKHLGKRPPRVDASVELERFEASDDPVEMKRRERRAAWYALDAKFRKMNKSVWAACFAYAERFGVRPHEDNIFRTKAERDAYWSIRQKGAKWYPSSETSSQSDAK